MSEPSRVWLWWSSGKDGAWALNRLRERDGVRVEALVTTLDVASGRVGMHGTPRGLVEAQASALGLELRVTAIPWPAPNEVYERAFGDVVEAARTAGVDGMAFGDLYLEEIRAYREGLLEGTGIEPLFPLWGRDTARLAREMLAGGIDAVVTCVDGSALPARLAGRAWDATFLSELPDGVDPCGENGEFHTFVRGGPGFRERIEVTLEEPAERDGFVYAEPAPTP